MDAFSNYIREQMKSKVLEFHSLSDLNVEVTLVHIRTFKIMNIHWLVGFASLTDTYR